MFYDIVISVQSGVKYTTNLIGCAMTLTKNIFKHTYTHFKTHYTNSIHRHTQTIFTNTFSSIKTCWYCSTNAYVKQMNYFNNRICKTFVSLRGNKPITQLYFSQDMWERKWKWLEFSLSWTLQWFTPTTEATAMNINNQGLRALFNRKNISQL